MRIRVPREGRSTLVLGVPIRLERVIENLVDWPGAGGLMTTASCHGSGIAKSELEAFSPVQFEQPEFISTLSEDDVYAVDWLVDLNALKEIGALDVPADLAKATLVRSALEPWQRGVLLSSQRGVFVEGPTGEPEPCEAADVKLARNDSDLARLVGIPALKEEKSRNYSVGLTWNARANTALTVDVYRIDIDDRIVLTGGFTDDLITAQNLLEARFFTNAIDTRTRGVDVVAPGVSVAPWRPSKLPNGERARGRQLVRSLPPPGGQISPHHCLSLSADRL